MKTIPLEEALKLATARPLRTTPSGPRMRDQYGQPVSIEDETGTNLVAGVFGEVFAGVHVANTNADTNAALLAHFYNLGPELVGVLNAIVSARDEAALSDPTDPAYIMIDRAIESARSILAKASTVQMP